MFPEVPGAQGVQVGRRLLDSNHETVYDSRMTQEITLGVFGVSDHEYNVKNTPSLPAERYTQVWTSSTGTVNNITWK